MLLVLCVKRASAGQEAHFSFHEHQRRRWPAERVGGLLLFVIRRSERQSASEFSGGDEPGAGAIRATSDSWRWRSGKPIVWVAETRRLPFWQSSRPASTPAQDCFSRHWRWPYLAGRRTNAFARRPPQRRHVAAVPGAIGRPSRTPGASLGLRACRTTTALMLNDALDTGSPPSAPSLPLRRPPSEAVGRRPCKSYRFH